MRRLFRVKLSSDLQNNLEERQIATDREHANGLLNSQAKWKDWREESKKQLRDALGKMVSRHRCMYCLDSHGSDIEHFWPKSNFPECMFVWYNLLLACSTCNRLKGTQFPLDEEERPLLIDPTVEDPWQFLDFDPKTGNLNALYLIQNDEYSPKGEKTVEILSLDSREGVSKGYKKAFERLGGLVNNFLERKQPTEEELPNRLQEEDEDYGLLPWCLKHSGKDLSPFAELRKNHPAVWLSLLTMV